MKKRYKKKSLKKRLYPVLISLLVLAVSYWLFLEISEPKYANEWSEKNVNDKSKIFFPGDEGLHSEKMEWWSYNGFLLAKSGKKYGFHFTIFLENNVITNTIFHSSLSDYQNNSYLVDQNRTTGKPSPGALNRFYFKQENWVMYGAEGLDRIKLDNKKFSLNLKLEKTQDPINHGNHGNISLGSAGNSYYYSRAKMSLSGDLVVDGVQEEVKGDAWFNHQWGDLSISSFSWDWFGFQLDNGVDLMLYQIRDKDGTPLYYEGSYTKQGKVEILKQSDFMITPKSTWASKKTSITYPVSWEIKIPKKNITLNVKSSLKNSEFDARPTTYNAYWKGTADVSGSHTGRGFIELNGTREKDK